MLSRLAANEGVLLETCKRLTVDGVVQDGQAIALVDDQRGPAAGAPRPGAALSAVLPGLTFDTDRNGGGHATASATVVSRGGRPGLAGPQALTLVRAPTLLIVDGRDEA